MRKAAARMAMHRTTAFRWRHRFLTLPREVKAQQLAGVAEVDETYVLRSCKGQRRRLRAEQTRKPRRGGRAAKRGLSALAANRAAFPGKTDACFCRCALRGGSRPNGGRRAASLRRDRRAR